MENKNVGIIGIGNCGCQIANLAEKKYPTLFDCIYFNTSSDDLAMVSTDTGLKFKLGDEDIKGSAKIRSKSFEYFEKELPQIISNEAIQNVILEKSHIFIITSVAGGTGSGAAPAMHKIMSNLFPDVNFIMVAILPKQESSELELENSLEFLEDLYENLGTDITYMMYDNETTCNEKGSLSLTKVNENVVEDIRILTGVDNYPTPFESIDAADMDSLLTTPGRLLVARINKGVTEKAMEDNKLDEIIIKSIKSSCHAETDRNKKVVRWGVVTYFTEDVNNLYVASLDALKEFLGTPVERFNHNAINSGKEDMNFIYLIAAGLSPINDRAVKIKERIEYLKEQKADNNSYVLSGTSTNTNENRKNLNNKTNTSGEINSQELLASLRRK
jgi:cell division GTPase FtsZ